MRPWTIKTVIEAVDKASKTFFNVNKASDKLTKSVTEGSQTSGSAFSRMSATIGMSVKTASVHLGNFNARVNQISRNVGKRINGMLGTLGKLGVGIAVGTVLMAVTSANVELDASFASLSAITGKTGTEFIAFKDQVSNVAKAQKQFAGDTAKAFEIVASAKPELLGNADALARVTNAAITLSKASGDDLATSALSLAGVMNQFNLAASESERVMNTLAAGSVAGSANITNVAASMKNFGAVAAGANISMEQSVALVEVLGSKSIFAEEAGTKLRGSILKLQQAGVGYASGQFNINDALGEAKIKLDKLSTARAKDAYLLKTFGAENITTGQILMNNIDMYKEMTKSVTGTTWAVDQASIKANTFSNRWTEIQNSFKNSVTTFQSNTDQMNGLKTAMVFVADNMDKIIKVVVIAIGVFVAFKTTMIALRVAQAVLNGVAFAYNVILGVQSALSGSAAIAMRGNAVAIWVMNAATKAMSVATLIYNVGLTGAIAATWAFTAALLANPITWVVVGIVALVAGIVLLIKHWDLVKQSFNSFYEKVKSSPFQILIMPFILIVDYIKAIIQGFKDIKAAFQFGSISDGFKAIGMSIFNFVITPVKVLLSALSKIPGLGKFAQMGLDKITGFQENNAFVKPKANKLPESEIVNKYLVGNYLSGGESIVKNEHTITGNDKLTDSINKNTLANQENTEIQKAKKDEWKGKFYTSILKNVNTPGFDRTITNELATTKVRSEENIINSQKNLNRETNLIQNTSNITSKDIVSTSEIIKQREVTNEKNIATNSVSNQKMDTKKQELVITLIDKTGNKFGIQVESTGIEVIRTGNA